MDTYQNDNGGKPVQPPQVRALLVAGAAGRCIHYKAMCTRAAKFMAFTFQAHCEPKCTDGATFWGFRAGQLLARAHALVPHAFRRVSYSEISVPLYPWTLIINFSGPPFAQPRLHVSPACWDLCTDARRPGARFPETSLLSSPLRPGIAASRGSPSGGRVSRSCCPPHGPFPSPPPA